jgi:signal transduction histidine kinase
MRLSSKIFLGIFLVSSILGSGLIWVSHAILVRRAEHDFVSRYRTLSDVVARSLTQLDSTTGALMLSAAKVVALNVPGEKPLDARRLLNLRNELGVTHLFLIRKDGSFTRSTNEAPGLIPNLYSFSSQYKTLLDKNGPLFVETPIIPATPDPNPFKFLAIANATRTQLIEVAVRADFVAGTLSEALKSDKNLTSLKLMAPDGASLGEYHADGVSFVRSSVPIAAHSGDVVRSSNGYQLYSKVDAKDDCGECEVSGHTRDGKYAYWIETSVSNRELGAALASMKKIFIWIELFLILFSAVFARIVSSKMSARVSQLVDQLGDIDQLHPNRRRLKLKGRDEISYLSIKFDQLLDRLQDAQSALVSSQRQEIASEIAKEVSHNIQSPIASLEGLIDKLAILPDSDQGVFRTATREIRALSEKLGKRGRLVDSLDEQPFNMPHRQETKTLIYDLSILLTQVVQSKKLEFESRAEIRLHDGLGCLPYGLFGKIDLTEFTVLVSNLLNNAMESGSEVPLRVELSCESVKNVIRISIRDNGRGIPPSVLLQLGLNPVTYGKERGSGIGVLHASRNIKKWGGTLVISSQEGIGTEVILEVPRVNAPAWHLPELSIASKIPVIVDDSPSIHELWRRRPEFQIADKTVDFHSSQKFLNWWLALPRAERSQYFILMDFVFPGEPFDGLQVLEQVNGSTPDATAILVTSSYDDKTVLQRATWLGVKIIPKTGISSIPISVQATNSGLTTIAVGMVETTGMPEEAKL